MKMLSLPPLERRVSRSQTYQSHIHLSSQLVSLSPEGTPNSYLCVLILSEFGLWTVLVCIHSILDWVSCSQSR